MSTYFGNGPITLGDVSTLSTIQGYVIIGGDTNVTSITGNGSGTVGGSGTTHTISSIGGVSVGGSARTVVIAGNGGVSVASSGTIGSASTDTNLILIGGTNTTLYGTGSVCVGPSTQTTRYQPTNGKLYLKDSYVVTKLNTTFTTPGVLTSAAISGGMIQFTTTSGAYTLPTTAQLCTELLDTSATAFTGTPNHLFQVTFYNTSGGLVTVALGLGQTFTSGTSPFSIANGESKTISMWFTSPTTMLVEDAKSGTFTVTEPFYTTNSRAIVSGTGNVFTSVSSTSGGGTFGGSGSTPVIATATGAVTVGGNTVTTNITGVGATVIGSLLCAGSIAESGSVIVGSQSFTGGFSSTNGGNVVVGSSGYAGTITSSASGSVVVSSAIATISSSLTGIGSALVGSVSHGATISGNGSVVVASHTSGTTVSCLGGAVVGSYVGAGSISSIGGALVGSHSFSGSVTGVGGGGNVVVGSLLFAGATANAGTVVVGSASAAASASIGGNGSVLVGSAGFAGSITGGGSVVVGSNATVATFLISSIGSVVVGSGGLDGTLAGHGAVIVGGGSIVRNMTGTGAVAVGGVSNTVTINSNGGVSIASAGTIGSTGTDTNLVLIGGTNTTLYGAGSVCIGSSSTTQIFSPNSSQTFIKSNPIYALTPTGVTAAVTLTPNQLVRGYIDITGGGAITLTFPQADVTYSAVIDNTAAAPTLYMAFNFLIRNEGGGSVTLSAGGVNPFVLRGTTTAISNASVRGGTVVFTSATTGIIFLYG